MSWVTPNNIVALIIALSIHEFAHAYTAYILGDDTAKSRISLNPLVHLDIWGTLMLLIVGFGWGKPVEVNPYNFKNPRKDIALVALAGPVSNFITAFICFAILQYIDFMGLAMLLSAIMYLNLGLGIFNLIPLYPLDGSKIIFAFLNTNTLKSLQPFFQNGPFILIAIILIENFLHIPLLSKFIYFFIEKFIYLFDFVI